MKTFEPCCSAAKSCLTLCNPKDCSMPGSFILHRLLVFAQICVHWVSETIYHLIDCSSLVSASPPLPDQQLFESALQKPGKVIEAGVCSLQTRNGGQKVFNAQVCHGVLLGFTRTAENPQKKVQVQGPRQQDRE